MSRTDGFDPYRDPVETPRFRSQFGGLWTDLSNANDLVEGKLALGVINELEAQELLAFIESGYAVLRLAVDAALIDKLNSDVAEIAKNPPPEAWVNCIEDGRSVTRQMTLGDGNAVGTMLKLTDLYHFLPSARDVIFAPKTLRFLQLVFERPVLAHQSLFFFKGSQQPVHRDTAFVRVSSPLEFCASWTALEDIQPGSGELVYYPKSHLFPEFLFEGKYKWMPPGSQELGGFYSDLHAASERASSPQKTFLANKGDVLIWSADLAHGGGAIDDPNKTRQSIVAHYCPANTYPMYRHYEGSSDIKHYANGASYCQANKAYWRSGD